MRRIRSLLLILGFCYGASVQALPQDTAQMMHIQADTSEFNYKTGHDIYAGHVQVDQGTSHLRADRLVTQKNAEHKITSAIAYGEQSLAEYTTIPRDHDVTLNAQAHVIKFYPEKGLVVLEGEVTVHQGNNSFHGPHIVYNIKDQVVSAPPSSQGQSTLLIQPEQLAS